MLPRLKNEVIMLMNITLLFLVLFFGEKPIFLQGEGSLRSWIQIVMAG